MIKIITHNGKFHADDVFAVATLLLVLEKEGKTAEVMRTRDPEVIKTGDYVVDVGFVYDPNQNRFDHHQKEGAGVRSNSIPYASFGLVWKKYGDILSSDSEVVQRIDRDLVQPIDARDNGIDFVVSKIDDLVPFDIRSMLDMYRPTWKEEKDFDQIFMKLVSYAREIITRMLVVATDAVDGERAVRDAYSNTSDKRVVEIPDEQCPWREVLRDFAEPLFIMYENKNYGTWSLKAIPVGHELYIARRDLPESWAGKQGKDLEEVTGVPGSVFCHRARFLAVATTKEAILQLAQIALNQ